MNIQVNLINRSELRSGSLISLRSVLRIASIVAPACLLVWFGSGVLGLVVLRSELKVLEARWEKAEPQKSRALRLTQELLANKEVLAELYGWRNSHVDWHAQLSGLSKIVPLTVQVRGLNVSQVFQTSEEGGPTRTFTLTISGKATGRNAEQDVHFVKQQLSETPAFTDLMETVTVTEYGEDTDAHADAEDRVFEIQCRYRPRSFR